MPKRRIGEHQHPPTRRAGNAGSNAGVSWTEEDILRLHGALLEKSLHDLFDRRVSAKTKADILDWVRAPSSEFRGFTYQSCCHLFGLDDEAIRDQVLAHYERQYSH
jgi:hypothetical protein